MHLLCPHDRVRPLPPPEDVELAGHHVLGPAPRGEHLGGDRHGLAGTLDREAHDVPQPEQRAELKHRAADEHDGLGEIGVSRSESARRSGRPWSAHPHDVLLAELTSSSVTASA